MLICHVLVVEQGLTGGGAQAEPRAFSCSECKAVWDPCTLTATAEYTENYAGGTRLIVAAYSAWMHQTLQEQIVRFGLHVQSK